MVDLVRAPGPWGGVWQWGAVAERLRAAGHRVFPPTLTGLGEREHLVNRETGLDTHIDDVANVIVWEGLRDIVLAGTSYGGLVISGVADPSPERIRTPLHLRAVVARES